MSKEQLKRFVIDYIRDIRKHISSSNFTFLVEEDSYIKALVDDKRGMFIVECYVLGGLIHLYSTPIGIFASMSTKIAQEGTWKQ